MSVRVRLRLPSLTPRFKMPYIKYIAIELAKIANENPFAKIPCQDKEIELWELYVPKAQELSNIVLNKQSK